MEAVRDLARQTIARNAVALRDALGLHPVKAKQWWNVPAKAVAASKIAAEEKRRFEGLAKDRKRMLNLDRLPGHNDDIDAARHAETSYRVASEVDPLTAEILGNGVEAVGLLRAVPAALSDLARGRKVPDYAAEMRMDLHNNAVGRAAAVSGQGIDPRLLQNAPRR